MEIATRPATRKATAAAATRRALLRTARRLFAQRGYAGVSLDEIAARARVTKGALYHHFADKQDLFRAVCLQLEEEWVEAMLAGVAAEADPRARLELGCTAYLDACLDPEIQRIVLLDGPVVLGLAELREIDARRGLGLLATALRDAIEAGQLERQPVEPLAHLLLGALNEASLAIARDADPAAARERMARALGRMIDGLEER